jgi:G:T/U-mismatch repair DNA glycosylase
MAYKTLNEYKEECHLWEPFIPVNANKLILGTFPTAKNNRKAYDFFYPNPNNEFWKLIFKVNDKNLDDYKSEDPIKIRKEVLSNLNLGIADIGYRILRQRGSSKDQNLFPIEYTDIFKILDDNLKIEKIIITSSGVLFWFHHYCELNNYTFKIPKEKLPTQTILTFKNRNIKIEIVSSPSRLSPIKGDKLIAMYRKAILFKDLVQT